MNFPTFFRGTLPDLWVGLSSDTALSRVQDLGGIAGQASLTSQSTGATVPLPLVGWDPGSRAFGGKVLLASIQDGPYLVAGTGVDAHGNATPFAFGFTLVTGAAPENGAITIPLEAASSPMVEPLPPGPSLIAMLLPGVPLSFPAPGASSVPFPVPSTIVRF